MAIFIKITNNYIDITTKIKMLFTLIQLNFTTKIVVQPRGVATTRSGFTTKSSVATSGSVTTR